MSLEGPVLSVLTQSGFSSSASSSENPNPKAFVFWVPDTATLPDNWGQTYQVLPIGRGVSFKTLSIEDLCKHWPQARFKSLQKCTILLLYKYFTVYPHIFYPNLFQSLEEFKETLKLHPRNQTQSSIKPHFESMPLPHPRI